MKSISLFIIFLCIIISMPLFLACQSDDDDDSSVDDDTDADDDDDDNDDDNDTDADDDDDNDDDNNDNDNDDDMNIPEGTMVFTGPSISMGSMGWGNWLSMYPSTFLLTDTGWHEYQFPPQTKGVYFLAEVIPLFTYEGEKSFALYSFDVLTKGTIENFGYTLMSFTRQSGWVDEYRDSDNRVNALHAVDDEVWYTLTRDGLQIYDHGTISDIALPNTSEYKNLYFIDQGEGIVSGVESNTGHGIYHRISQGNVTTHAMPTGFENHYFINFWLYDIDNGWALSTDNDEFFAGTHLWRLEGGTWTQVTPPAGCQYTFLWQLEFADENFGIVGTDSFNYLLYDNGTWSCETLPSLPSVPPIDFVTSFVHVLSPQHYYIGQTNTLLYTSLYEFINGVQTTIQLPTGTSPIGINDFSAITTIGTSAPRFTKQESILRLF